MKELFFALALGVFVMGVAVYQVDGQVSEIFMQTYDDGDPQGKHQPTKKK